MAVYRDKNAFITETDFVSVLICQLNGRINEIFGQGRVLPAKWFVVT